MLLHYAGEEVFDLGELLGIVDETSFDDTKRVLTEYYAPRSQIIQKCQSRTVRDNGLSEPSISLAALIKYGRTLEVIHAQAKRWSAIVALGRAENTQGIYQTADTFTAW